MGHASIARRSEQQRPTVLGRLGQRLAVDRRVGSLPLGQQQIVEIARALVHDTRVLMMDEPTSALTAAEIPVLFSLIRDLTAHGVAIVYISHRLEELLAIADRRDRAARRRRRRPRRASRRQRAVDRQAHDRVAMRRQPRRMPAPRHANPILAVKDLDCLPAAAEPVFAACPSRSVLGRSSASTV